jgi:hypothetical protein
MGTEPMTISEDPTVRALMMEDPGLMRVQSC